MMESVPTVQFCPPYKPFIADRYTIILVFAICTQVYVACAQLQSGIAAGYGYLQSYAPAPLGLPSHRWKGEEWSHYDVGRTYIILMKLMVRGTDKLLYI